MSNLISQKIKDDLRQLGIEPKKSLGQNFLINEGIYKKIINALEIENGDTIIEVGPGLGTLTEFLAKTEARVTAIEKDSRLVDWLKNKFDNYKNVKIEEGDALEINSQKFEVKENGYKVVGNIPYYITSHLIRNILEDWPAPKSVVLMVQKEVAQRICAKPPDMSLLALSVRYYATPKIISYVSSGSFMPAPEVDSAIVKFSEFKKQDKEFSKNLFTVARAGFGGKRKQLLNSLSSGLKKTREEIEEKLELSGIDPQKRPGTLTVQEWEKITKNLF